VYKLQLYLAKHGTEWLQEDDLEELSVLYGSFVRMKATLRIDDSNFKFPDEDKLGRDEIHVLVELSKSKSLTVGVEEREITSFPRKRKERWDRLNPILENIANDSGNKRSKKSTAYSLNGVCSIVFIMIS